MGYPNNDVVRERDSIDDAIDRCELMEHTLKSREEVHWLIKRAVTCMNLAHVLADVCETLVLDCESILRPVGAQFEREDKRNFNDMARRLRDARKACYRACKGPYSTPDGDDYAQECDWWYNMIRLLADRVGENKLKTEQVLNWICTMPSEMNMFKVKKRDFQHLA